MFRMEDGGRDSRFYCVLCVIQFLDESLVTVLLLVPVKNCRSQSVGSSMLRSTAWRPLRYQSDYWVFLREVIRIKGGFLVGKPSKGFA